jgi:hypothetical protein
MTARASDSQAGVTVRLVGGLGNQLFGYATARAVATRLGCPLFVDTGYFAQQPPGDTPRAFELGWLVNPEQVVRAPSQPPSNRLLRAVTNRMQRLLSSSEFHESSFEYDCRIKDVSPGTTLNGYFQSWRYFESIAPDLRHDLLSRAPTSSWFRDQAQLLEAKAPWIAVHVRRGDYSSPQNASYHGLLGSEYYERALSALGDRIPQARVALFSDDPEQALALIQPHHNVDHVVMTPADTHPMESISLMSRASAVITANSSFSWWGAWLADPERTPAIAPTPWFGGASHGDTDLLPPQWLRLPHSLTT